MHYFECSEKKRKNAHGIAFYKIWRKVRFGIFFLKIIQGKHSISSIQEDGQKRKMVIKIKGFQKTLPLQTFVDNKIRITDIMYNSV